MRKKLIFAIVSILLSSNLFAIDSKTKSVSNNAVSSAKKEVKDSSNVVKQAIKAINYTHEALLYLNKKETKKAKDVIKKSIGELAEVLNTKNAPYLLLIDSKVNVYEFVANIKEVSKIKNRVKELIEQNKLVEARRLLNSLRDKIDIVSVNLPLATYPKALELSLKYINENKIDEAKDVLSMALSTLVNVETIIPIPLLKAQSLVEEAKKISKKDKSQALKYLNEAKYQLKLAQTLGYHSLSNTTYKSLKNSIDELKSELNKGNKTKGLFDNLIDKLKSFKDKAISSSNH
jgi:hypothetical protein